MDPYRGGCRGDAAPAAVHRREQPGCSDGTLGGVLCIGPRTKIFCTLPRAPCSPPISPPHFLASPHPDHVQTPLKKPKRSLSNSSFQFGQWGKEAVDLSLQGTSSSPGHLTSSTAHKEQLLDRAERQSGVDGGESTWPVRRRGRGLCKDEPTCLSRWQTAAIRSMSPMPSRVGSDALGGPFKANLDLSHHRGDSAGLGRSRRDGLEELQDRPPRHELVAALYKWLSRWQDPEFMLKAVKRLGLQDCDTLTEDEMLGGSGVSNRTDSRSSNGMRLPVPLCSRMLCHLVRRTDAEPTGCLAISSRTDA